MCCLERYDMELPVSHAGLRSYLIREMTNLLDGSFQHCCFKAILRVDVEMKRHRRHLVVMMLGFYQSRR